MQLVPLHNENPLATLDEGDEGDESQQSGLALNPTTPAAPPSTPAGPVTESFDAAAAGQSPLPTMRWGVAKVESS
jgi:hypothetical protein